MGKVTASSQLERVFEGDNLKEAVGLRMSAAGPVQKRTVLLS
jgi:hypothetical protein